MIFNITSTSSTYKAFIVVSLVSAGGRSCINVPLCDNGHYDDCDDIINSIVCLSDSITTENQKDLTTFYKNIIKAKLIEAKFLTLLKLLLVIMMNIC
ncbi:CLUMA_CG002109, isoform A [Clunio marinus]|uniref:CLUMA_CG002109, isoform A n=1 Tax=Clunio marinus TaxID=568069 RepID=A0A1J1HLB0_9DIPT|nr:CLUMA_CG002109, isoform A [Clunio marinus]